MSDSSRIARGIGIAIFVKTPGYSPIKTRLAAAIGREAAEAFHRMAAACVVEIASDSALTSVGATAYWAVAEDEALDAPEWRALPRIAQGEGDLGERMRAVYETLRARHDAAILIGADAPQLRVDDLLAACAALHSDRAVIGPSEDGGFWSFGGRDALPNAAWTRTPWSQPETLARFVEALGVSPIGLRRLRDVDTLEDLRALRIALDAMPQSCPAQRALTAWLTAMRA
jgi:hypothetical protein